MISKGTHCKCLNNLKIQAIRIVNQKLQLLFYKCYFNNNQRDTSEFNKYLERNSIKPNIHEE